MSVRSASSGSAAARSIRLALRASSIVATSSDSFPRCVLRCRGRNCSNSALMLSARRSIPVIGRVLAPPKAEALNHTPVHHVNNPSHQTDGWQVEKPFATDRLVNSVQRALERRSLTLEVETLRRKLSDREGIEAMMLGQSAAIQEVRRVILQVADTSADVLILGETGTGKELVARCLHQFSRRRDHNFVAINCGAMPETMFESEVFGHESGAFTGASRQRIGRLEYAHGGTLLLDEIESMPLSLQVKLLRALQEHTIERLGSNREIPIDARIVAATKDDLGELSKQQKFRSDLYYRLNVVTIDLPALRDRREDVPLLFEHFVLQAATRYHRDAPVLSEPQRRQLMA